MMTQNNEPKHRTSVVGRREILARLHALADETRLDILTLLSQAPELSAQAIINQLGLPQSSISRHLNQLRAAGFITERRAGGANKAYRLVTEQLPATVESLQQWFAGALETPAPPPPVQGPLALQRFLDPQGMMVIWPSKHTDRMAILVYLTTFFELQRVYTEREVNDVLRQHPGIDHVNLRRALCDYGFLKRESDGSAYWRAE